MAKIAAVDIGGANIKCFGPGEQSLLRPFRLWRYPHDLSTILSDVFDNLGHFDVLAVTMTGEHCDCFETKAEGVRHILAAVKAAAVRRSGTVSSGKRGWPEVLVWRTDRRLGSLSEALADPLPSSAANWLALAMVAGRLAPAGRSLLVDIGSTTTDLIPIRDGDPAPSGLTDTERLMAGELVYTGVSRTPVSAVVHELPYRGRLCPIAAEVFATTRDAYLILELLPEAQDDVDTADGRPATRDRARDRLARMICADPAGFDDEAAGAAARHILSEQVLRLRQAVLRFGAGPLSTVIISGSGEFLARQALQGLSTRVVSLAATMNAGISTVAPAYALWCLAAEHVEGKKPPQVPA